MKKLILGAVLSTFSIFGSNVQGQITITSADFPSIGDGVINAYDTLVPAGTVVGPTGSQTWDFSAMSSDYTDTTLFVDPVSTPNGLDFPNATIATKGAGFFVYLEASSTALKFSGIATDFAGSGNVSSIHYNPQQKVFEFPSTDGTSFTDTSAFDFAFAGSEFGAPLDSIGIIHSSFFTSTIDAYGMVTTPTGTYDAIRQYTMEITYDSVMMNDALFTGGTWILMDSSLLGFPNPAIDTVYNYQWYANGEGAPVMELETDGPAGNVLEGSWKEAMPFIAGIKYAYDASCAGSCDGSIRAEAFNGVAPYGYLWSDGVAQTTLVASNLCAGSYSVTITDAIGNTSTTTGTISQPDSLMISLVSTGPSCPGCSDGTATANITGGTAPYIYAWNDPAAQSTATATNLAIGVYSVTVTDGNVCVVASDTVSVVGIESIGKVAELGIYPNPTSGIINIDLVGQDLQVRIVDILGKTILVKDLEGKTVDLSLLPAGSYYVQVWDGTLLRSQKVILIR